MANATDVLIYTFLGGGIAYVTNFMGFKAWADANLFQQPPPPAPPIDGGGGGVVGGGGGSSSSGDDKPIKNDPPPRTGTTFKCVTYPRCNTVSGTDARKKCCCSNKCALLGRTFKSINYSTGECYCNPKPTTTTTPTKCLGPCPLGKRPGLVSGKCGCVNCTNTCTGCYDRVTNCGCKLNTSKLAYNSANCQISCGNRTCWTNVPCGGSSKVKVCVDGNSCTTAKNAWLAKYACKTTACPYSGCTSLPKGSTCFYCRCAKLCGSRGVREVKSDGSCFCRTTASVARFEGNVQTVPHEAMDEGMFGVPSIA